jgi:hypothetical protein
MFPKTYASFHRWMFIIDTVFLGKALVGHEPNEGPTVGERSFMTIVTAMAKLNPFYWFRVSFYISFTFTIGSIFKNLLLPSYKPIRDAIFGNQPSNWSVITESLFISCIIAAIGTWMAITSINYMGDESFSVRPSRSDNDNLHKSSGLSFLLPLAIFGQRIESSSTHKTIDSALALFIRWCFCIPVACMQAMPLGIGLCLLAQEYDLPLPVWGNFLFPSVVFLLLYWYVGKYGHDFLSGDTTSTDNDSDGYAVVVIREGTKS